MINIKKEFLMYSSKSVFTFYVIIFFLFLLLTLNTNYVEGDDASTILYHLCGRDSSIQLPYASYNSGFDFMLKFLPTDEVILRNFSVYISFLFGFIVLFLSFLVIKTIIEKKGHKLNNFFFYLLPFIIPDYIFHSLIINSTNVSFAFALLSLFFFLKIDKNKSYILLSIICMALSLPFRWSMLLFYPLFFCLSILVCVNKNDSIRLLKLAFYHHALSLALGLLFIYLTGYNINSFYEIILWGNKYMENKEFSILSLFATGSAFITPAFIILLFLGIFSFFYFRKYRTYQIYFLIIPFVPFVILGLTTSFKFWIVLTPIVLLILYSGFQFALKSRFVIAMLLMTLASMWFIGVKLDASGTLYGEGFGYRVNLNKSKQLVNEKNTDERIKIKAIKLSFDGGFYMPTLEGPRPIYGYFYVLFGGLWKKNIENFTETRRLIVESIIFNQKVFYFQDRKTSFLQCDLFRYGFKTTTNFVEGAETYRKFSNGKKNIKLNILPNNVSLEDYLKLKMSENKGVIFRSSYPSLILKTYNISDELGIIDPFTISNFSMNKSNFNN